VRLRPRNIIIRLNKTTWSYGDRLKKVRNYSIAAIAFFILSGSAGAQVITNEQAVANAAREGVLTNFQDLKPGNINIRVLDNDITRPVAIGLSEGFEGLGFVVFGNDESLNNVQYLECDILGFEFKYENGDSRGFLRKRMIRRKFIAALKLTFMKAEDKHISGIKDITISFEDQINPEWGDLVKSRKIPALDPPFPSSGLVRVVEPVIVTSAVGALVYLFFANR
jgi:hypothetical protein